jgi:UDP-N-acetylglucosamine 1-carboxyvinyltransferase
MKESFVIQGLAGEKKLKGEIAVCGAKNEALKLMAASILCEGPLSLENMPDIEDVRRMAEIIEKLGGSVQITGLACEIDTGGIMGGAIDRELARSLRSSIVLTGPLLARFGNVSFPHPGGDLIGERPVDFFIEGFEKMGATTTVENGEYHVSAAGGLKGADIFFRWVSVTATETLMMAATLAKGTTTLRNVAMEPEVIDLAEFLVAAGAKIAGIGTPTLVIEGGVMLKPTKPWRVIPDRIEAGSFLILGALAATELKITNCEPEHLRMIIELLSRSGVHIETAPSTSSGQEGFIKITNGAADVRTAIALKTHEYPGFPTDLQAPMVVYLTQAEGESRIFETIFEGRLNYTQDLVRMGADIALWNPHQAAIKGPTPLRGATLESPDIRAGLAFLIAALIAEGESTLQNIYHIDRGYGRIEERFRALGADIRRVQN